MQIQYFCPDCFQERVKNKDVLGLSNTSFSIELTDNCIMTYECPNGHKGIFIIQNPKFEILFDFGILSYLEGYTRESVSSLIASYERFLEFATKIFSKRLGMQYDLYKTLSENDMKFSERQMGAYYALYLACMHEMPKLIKHDTAHFRNNVIHSGYIPTQKEVEKFADKLLLLMLPVLNRIKKVFQKELIEFTTENIQEKFTNDFMGLKSTTMCMPTSLGVYSESETNKTFGEMVLMIDKMKGITFSKFYEQSQKENRYTILNSLFGKYV